ncbi:MAG: T9SS type A sorting domain-containing protein [Bacteroidales bacterium]|nr:T9SS type A sorting domain-containing protein [Bacteroidales bacterium]
MKTKALLITGLFYSLSILFQVQAQGVYEWGPAIPITDSASFNSNPTGWLIDNQQFGVFYEKRVCDTCNADIWYRNLTTMDPEIPVLTGNEMHDNPVFVSAYANDFEGFILYLSNMDGDTNIYAAKLNNDLTISEITQLTFTERAEHSMTISTRKQHLGWVEDSCVWITQPDIENGQIMLSEITKLDSLKNTSLVIGSNNASFQRKVGDSLHIFGRNYEYSFGTESWYWDETYPIKTTGNNTDLTVDQSEFSSGEEVIWVTNNQIHGFSYSYEFVLNTCNLPNIQHPSYIMWDIIVKNEWMPHVLLYATGEDNNTEIYGSFSEYGNAPDTTNLTNDGVLNSNPKLYWGEYDGIMGFWIYAVWQSHRNGYVALDFAKFLGYIEGGVSEQPASDITISTTPNPFSREVQINVNSTLGADDIQVTIYSLSGKPVWEKTIVGENQPFQSCVWIPAPHIPKGLYLVEARQNRQNTTCCMIYK